MLGILRDIAAVDDDQIGLQLGKFSCDGIMEFRFVEPATESGSPTSIARRARNLLVQPTTGTAVTLYA